MRGNPFLHDRKDAGDQRQLAMAAVREKGVVDCVDETGIGPRLDDLAVDGQAAEPRVEDEDGRRRRHGGHESQTTQRVAIWVGIPAGWYPPFYTPNSIPKSA